MADNKTVLGQGYLGLPSGTTAERPATPSAGFTWFNTTLNVVETYHSGSGWIGLSNVFSAEGGTITSYSSGGINYKVHTFTSSGTFQVTAGAQTVDVLMVGGGGAGGASLAGGGGGGGVAVGTYSAITGNYSVVVGAGGAGQPSTALNGGNGQSTSVFGITVTGGRGAGGRYSDPDISTVCANGAGGSASGTNASARVPGTSGTKPVIAGFTTYGGFTGGSSIMGDQSPNYPGGGGAGANGNGQTPSSTSSAAGNGGSGIQLNFANSTYYWAGGGGGSAYTGGAGAGNGGIGGGGGGSANSGSGGTGGGSAINSGANGLSGSGNSNAQQRGGAGGANSGGGGGAANHEAAGGAAPNDGAGGNGGSGIVIIRYAI